MKKIIKDATGLSVKVLSQGFDNNTNLYYATCLFGASLCYVEISKDKKHILICTDDIFTLENISRILAYKKNKKSFSYINDLYDFKYITQYTNFKYKLKVVSDEEYNRELQKEIRQIKGR